MDEPVGNNGPGNCSTDGESIIVIPDPDGGTSILHRGYERDSSTSGSEKDSSVSAEIVVREDDDLIVTTEQVKTDDDIISEDTSSLPHRVPEPQATNIVIEGIQCTIANDNNNNTAEDEEDECKNEIATENTTTTHIVKEENRRQQRASSSECDNLNPNNKRDQEESKTEITAKEGEEEETKWNDGRAEEKETEEESKHEPYPLIGAVHVQQDLETGRIQATPMSFMTRQPQLTTMIEEDNNIEIATRPSTENLATANLVDSTEEELPVAQEFLQNRDDQPKPHHGRTPIYVGLGLLLAVGVLLLIFFLVKSSSRDDNNNGGTKDNTGKIWGGGMGSNKGDVQDYVLSLLPQYTISKIDLNDQISPTPQTRAFQWVLNDPYLYMYPDWRIIQRFALSTFFYATDGENWHDNTDWLSYDVDEIFWHSELHSISEEAFFEVFGFFGIDVQNLLDILIDYDGDEIAYLLLSSNGLDGELPEEFYLLSSLRVIDLHRNKQLGGTISTRFGSSFPKLEILSISGNRFTGTIPSEVGLLPSIWSILLLGNFLTGTIPTEVGVMPIWFLGLDGNQLTGPVPSEVGLMPHILSLQLFDNLLSSTLPSEIGQMTSLNELSIFGTQITGTIPTEIFSAFRKPDMTYYVEIVEDLYPNLAALARGLPLAAMLEANLAFGILIQRNQLVGPIPTQVGLVGSMTLFTAHYNQLTGMIPTELGNHAEMELLALHGNLLSGAVPSNLASVPALEFLTLSENLLTGPIPNELSQLSNLNILWMADNAFSSTIPKGLDALFAGEVPPCCNVEAVPLVGAELDLSRNLLSGPFPTSVGPKLVRLAVESNRLTGTISRDLGSNGWLAYVDAGHNLITGTIPGEIAGWPALKSFNVTSNLLTGNVPSGIGELLQGTSSIMFDLSNNSLESLP